MLSSPNALWIPPQPASAGPGPGILAATPPRRPRRARSSVAVTVLGAATAVWLALTAPTVSPVTPPPVPVSVAPPGPAAVTVPGPAAVTVPPDFTGPGGPRR